MANGDLASQRGFTPVNPGADVRQGYDDINRAADWAAAFFARLPFAMAAGSEPGSSADVQTVTFPPGRFAAPPVVVVTLGIYSQYAAYLVNNTTVSGCEVIIFNTVTAFSIDNVPFSWIAVQP